MIDKVHSLGMILVVGRAGDDQPDSVIPQASRLGPEFSGGRVGIGDQLVLNSRGPTCAITSRDFWNRC